MKRLSDLGPAECGVIERVDTPEEVMALVQMGCCIGSSVEVRHVAPADGPMAICTCGRTLAMRLSCAAHNLKVGSFNEDEAIGDRKVLLQRLNVFLLRGDDGLHFKLI